MVRVEELMTTDIASVDYCQKALQAVTIMKVRKIGSVFVTQNGFIVGIVTESDIVRKLVGGLLSPEMTPVQAIMSSPVHCLDENSSLFEAADFMQRYGIRHVGITRAEDIVGVLSARDLLHPVAMDEF